MLYSKKNFFLLVVFVLCVTSCQRKVWTISEYSTSKIAIDNTLEPLADKEYAAHLQTIKKEIDAEMNVVIGKSAHVMRAHRPESLLSNFSGDIFKEEASEFLKENIDIAVVNLGGLRTEIPAGNVTIGNMFELMPFENELVVLWLKGDKLAGLCDVFAQLNGEGVAGIKMGMKDGKAVDVTIGGKPLDLNKTYLIATNDYLAGGNDKMVQLAQYEKRVDTGIKVRDAFINYIKKQTKQGKEIKSQLDGRMYEIK